MTFYTQPPTEVYLVACLFRRLSSDTFCLKLFKEPVHDPQCVVGPKGFESNPEIHDQHPHIYTTRLTASTIQQTVSRYCKTISQKDDPQHHTRTNVDYLDDSFKDICEEIFEKQLAEAKEQAYAEGEEPEADKRQDKGDDENRGSVEKYLLPTLFPTFVPILLPTLLPTLMVCP